MKDYRIGWAGAAKLVADEMPYLSIALSRKAIQPSVIKPNEFSDFEKGEKYPEWSEKERHEYFADLIKYFQEPLPSLAKWGKQINSVVLVAAPEVPIEHGAPPCLNTEKSKDSQLPAGLSAADGWIAWGGGECPIPDAKANEYELQLSTWALFSMSGGPAKSWWWGKGSIIIAYRLLQDPNKWHDGPPPSVGWWSVNVGSQKRGPMAHWNGELWSIQVYSYETGSEIYEALGDRHGSPLQWRHGRPEWAKDIERLAGGV